MDPATLSLALNLGATAVQIAQQYMAGTITQEQAHAQLVDASSQLKQAIDLFNKAGVHP